MKCCEGTLCSTVKYESIKETTLKMGSIPKSGLLFQPLWVSKETSYTFAARKVEIRFNWDCFYNANLLPAKAKNYNMTTVVYHLQKVYAKSGWKVNGTPLFSSFQWKISGSNETWTVGPVFPLGYSKRKFVFPFLQSRELMLGETILSAKQLLKKNSEKTFALGTVSGF